MDLHLPFFKKEIKKDKPLANDIIPPETSDGSYIVDGGGRFITAYNTENQDISSKERIKAWRAIAKTSEVSTAIQDIINDAIYIDDSDVVMLDLDEAEDISDSIKEKLKTEFDYILNLLNYKHNAAQLLEEWYIDSKQYFHMVINSDKPKEGILKLNKVDPLKLEYVKEVHKEKNKDGVEFIKKIDEYFYMDNEDKVGVAVRIKLPRDSIAYSHSGLKDHNGKLISYLDKAVKPYNQLNDLEDSKVIYSVARAPEKRIFYVDVGNLPKSKAESYLNSVVTKFKNKLVYDSNKGTVKDGRHISSMMEDIFLARKNGCFSLDTEVRLTDGRNVSLNTLIDEYKQGKENWTYSVSDNGSVVPGLISWAGVTRRNEPVMEVHLDNDEVITCTLDHKFILRDGTKIEAQYLNDNDSLMPFYTDDEMIYDVESNDWVHQEEINNKTNFKNDKLLLSPEEFKEKYNSSSIVPTRNIDSHKVKCVKFIDVKMDVGTLTIDEDNIYHDYHNYSLTSGIFVMNSKGTEVTSIPSTGNLGDIEDIMYFRKKLYKALHIPLSRLEQETTFNLGRTGEITRDEIKFSRFISDLRNKYSNIFKDLLKTQVILKGIMTIDEWEKVKNVVYFEFKDSDYFTELAESEVMRDRAEAASIMTDYVGKYISNDYVRKEIFKMTDDEIKEQDKLIKTESTMKQFQPPEDGF